MHFNLRTAAECRGSLVIYDESGKKVATVFEGDLAAVDDRTVEYNFGVIARQLLIYIFTIGDQVIHGKFMPGGYKLHNESRTAFRKISATAKPAISVGFDIVNVYRH
jgi:hypothetical protein